MHTHNEENKVERTRGRHLTWISDLHMHAKHLCIDMNTNTQHTYTFTAVSENEYLKKACTWHTAHSCHFYVFPGLSVFSPFSHDLIVAEIGLAIHYKHLTGVPGLSASSLLCHLTWHFILCKLSLSLEPKFNQLLLLGDIYVVLSFKSWMSKWKA